MMPKIQLLKKQLRQIISEPIISIKRVENGFSNQVFFVKTKENEYVLRLMNDRSKNLEKKKLENEIFTLNYVKDNTTIPVPQVIDYSTSKNVFGYEYMLTKKIPGRPLNETYKYCSKLKKLDYLKQVFEFIVQLQKIKFKKIGNFDLEGNVAEIFDTRIGPFKSPKQLKIKSINAFLKIAQGNEIHKNLVNNISRVLIKDIDSTIEIVFTHYDIGPKNIIVNKGKVVGVIDWEWAGAYPWEQDFATMIYDFELNSFPEGKNLLLNIFKKNKLNFKISKITEDLFMLEGYAMTLAHYKDWASKNIDAEKILSSNKKQIENLGKKYL